MTTASHLTRPLQKVNMKYHFFLLISLLCLFKMALSQGCSLAMLTSLLATSALAWVHPMTFLCVDDVVRPEEGVIDLD